jgi:ferredoxin
LGPTWSAAPTRRFIQTACLLVFLTLLFYVCWPYGSPDYARTMRAKERIPAETFLLLDPLLAVSAALAAKRWIPALVWTGALLLVCVIFPRGFCGYLCPLGTLIDLFDWSVGRRFRKLHRKRRGGWVHLKYYLLAATLVAALFGVLVSGFVAAIPVVTRGLQFILGPLQIGLLKGWYLAPPLHFGHGLSIALFLAVLGLGLLQPRFWCRFVCPTGAVFSVANLFRLRERQVTDACIDCGQCVAICPFDAIQADFSTRPADCTVCETCGGVCPTGAIQYASRWHDDHLKPPATEPLIGNVPLSRRGFMAGAAGGLVAAIGVQRLFGARLNATTGVLPVRPPGSVPEREFLQLCIRCGACFQACPNNVLQPLVFEQGLEGLWTPQVVARWSGCEPSCNNCGQVCPTGAIRALPIEEKRAARMGLAAVNGQTCLPHAQREACQLCVDECKAAGYGAIEFQRVGTQVDAGGVPVEGSGFLAPVVLADLCVGCGLCETRCSKINVQHQRLLADSAIRVVAGPGNEDRLTHGSYRQLREAERQTKPAATPSASGATNDGYLPDFLK